MKSPSFPFGALLVLVFSLWAVPALGQGQINFNNRAPNLDARVIMADGTPISESFKAQLYGGPLGGSLSPLEPITTFRTGNAAGYVNPVVVTVPAIPPGAQAEVEMRVFNGATFESSSQIGISSRIIITLGGGTLLPANLDGLQWSLIPGPEPVPQPQGQINFNNRGPNLDARVIMADGTPVSEGFKAQLYGGPLGGPLFPLEPITTFRTGNAAGYVNAVTVTVPGIPPGAQAEVEMRIFNGATFESSSQIGVSSRITVTLGGGTLLPANLDGLQWPSIPGPATVPPQILQSPQNQTVRAGNRLILAAQVNPGTGPTQYQWTLNAVDIAGATSLQLEIANAQPNHSGAYRLRASSPHGSVTSDPAIVTVLAAFARSDFNRDGKPDLLFQHPDGHLALWFMNGAELDSASFLNPKQLHDPEWRAAGLGDFNGDGKTDILFQHADATLAVWLMDGANLAQAQLLNPSRPQDPAWKAVAVADFNQDNHPDIVLQHTDGAIALWEFNQTQLVQGKLFHPAYPADAGWHIASATDFNGDSKPDLLWQHTDGSVAIWLMNGHQLVQGALTQPSHPGDASWRIATTADFNSDRIPDILWQHADGSLAIWHMNGTALTDARFTTPFRPGSGWRVAK